MKNLVIFLKYNEPNYVIPLALELVKTTPSIKCYIVGKNFESENFNYYKQLQKEGAIFLVEEAYQYSNQDILLIDYVEKKRVDELKRKYDNPTFITYHHGTDSSSILENSYHIVSDLFEFNLVKKAYGVYSQNKHIFKVKSLNTEVYLGGYYNYFEMLPYLKLSKEKVRVKLEEKLGIKFNPELPLISYTVGQFLRENKLKKTLYELAKHYNVIVKELFSYRISQLFACENLFFCTLRREPMIKFASDINLISVGSSTIFSNFAFGLKSIPVYSYEMGLRFSSVMNNLIFEKMFYASNLYYFCQKEQNMQEYFELIPPVSIYDYKGIREIIENKTFWINFKKREDIKRKEIFGQLNLNDSIRDTVKYLLYILSK